MENAKPEKDISKEAPGSDPDPKPEKKGVDRISNSDGSQSQNQIESEASVNRTPSISKKSVHWRPDLVSESAVTDGSGDNARSFSQGSNPYLSPTPPVAPFSVRDTMDNVRDLFGRWRKKVGEATKKAEDLAGNTWQHLKTSPSFTEAALGRIAQGTKFLAEGGYEKIFQQSFETIPEELLQDSFACYLSTTAGPVMGILYVSTAKLAFCSDNPLSYKAGGQMEWSYYKVIIPLNELKAINHSTNRVNPAEKYIQVISMDNNEFWFMGFLNYYGALKLLEEACQSHNLQSV